MSSKINKSLKEGLIKLKESLAQKNATEKKEEENNRLSEYNDFLKRANRAIAEQEDYENNAITESKDRDKDGNHILHGVWEEASKNAKHALSSDSFKAFDNYQALMHSLIGIYIDLNIALAYSVDRLLPSFFKAFENDFNNFAKEHETFGGIVNAPAAICDIVGNSLSERLTSLKQDFLDSVVRSKLLPLSQETERRWLADDLNDVQRSLIVDDLLNVIDYNPRLKEGKFFGPIAGLEQTKENIELLENLNSTLQAAIDMWIGQHGYHRDNKGDYKNSDGTTTLTEKDFKALRDDKDNGLRAFLSQEFKDDLSYSPRI